MVDHDKSSVEVEENEINLLDLVAVIVKRKGIILKLTGAAIAISVIFSLSLPNIYTATSKFLPQTRQIGPLTGLSILMGVRLEELAGPQFADGANLYVDILKSRLVEDAVIRRFDLEKERQTGTVEETRKALERNVRIQASKEGLISVSVEDKDPERAAAIANAFVEELGLKIRQLKLYEEGTERVYLEKVLDQVGKELEKSKETLILTKEFDDGSVFDLAPIANLEENARLNAEIVSKEIQLDSLEAGQNRVSPRVKALKSEISIIRQKIKPDPAAGNTKYKKGLQDLKIRQELYELLKKQYEFVKLSEDKNPSSIMVLDKAVAPVQKSKPKRSLIVILSTVTAFFVGIVLAFAREYAENMPAEDKARWREIKNLAWGRRG